MRFFYPPQHDGLLDAVTFEGSNDFPELADTHPMHPVDHLLQLGSRFTVMSNGRHSKPEFSGVFGKNDGKPTIACDKAYPGTRGRKR